MAKNANSMNEDILGNVSGGVVSKSDAVTNSQDETGKGPHLVLMGSDGKVYGRYPNTDQGVKDMQASAERLGINIGTELKYSDGKGGVYNLN